MGRAQAPTTDGGVVAEEVAPAAAEGEFPWHNEDLALAERMKLADGKGLFEKLFAAMAQTDCTACGYDCEGYARAIADGEDTDLTKCAPGELETQETLEKLMGKK
jgi:sulfite reductase (NADPH) flavoprotein alpha-component